MFSPLSRRPVDGAFPENGNHPVLPVSGCALRPPRIEFAPTVPDGVWDGGQNLREGARALGDDFDSPTSTRSNTQGKVYSR
uniref:Uncharacterized protein n=1 Tax=Globodera rostochiensis TaxID=31243 RepID=A0A914HQK2_GLORO